MSLPDEVAPEIRPVRELAYILDQGVDPRRRVLHLDEIDESTGGWVSQVLAHLNSLSSAPIRIFLNTPGGDVTSMFAIHDAIRTSHAQVHVIGTGQVCSAGVLILACGHKRFVTESCCLMSHEPTIGAPDEGLGLRATKSRRKWEDWSQAWWCELMARYTPRDKDARWWAKTTERQAEYWLLGGRAIVEAGLADYVLSEPLSQYLEQDYQVLL